MEEMVALESPTTKMNLLTKTFFKTMHKIKTIIREGFSTTTKKIREVHTRVTIRAEVFLMLANSKTEDFSILKIDRMNNNIMIGIISLEEIMTLRMAIFKGFLVIVIIKILAPEIII